MPLVTLHLVALDPRRSITAYLDSIRSSSSVQPLVVARPIRWIIKPEKLSVSALLNEKWDLLLIFLKPSPLTHEHFSNEWTLNHFTFTAGVPSSFTNGFAERNQRLLYPQHGDVPPLTGSLSKPRMSSSTQGLELSDELIQWSKSFDLGKSPLSMLNLLAFKSGKDAHESYQKYGKEFAKSAGSSRGGQAKIVGKVVDECG